VKKRLVLLGAPGSGKGTQAELITHQFGIPVTSPGAILRREKDLGTPLGIETSEIIQEGGLVPDATIVKLIEDWLRLHGAHCFRWLPAHGPASRKPGVNSNPTPHATRSRHLARSLRRNRARSHFRAVAMSQLRFCHQCGGR
jgi:hypothetical protein